MNEPRKKYNFEKTTKKEENTQELKKEEITDIKDTIKGVLEDPKKEDIDDNSLKCAGGNPLECSMEALCRSLAQIMAAVSSLNYTLVRQNERLDILEKNMEDSKPLSELEKFKELTKGMR
jgi:hypothetical protein